MSKGYSFSVQTWDYGSVKIGPSTDRGTIIFILEKILQAGLWKEFKKFPRSLIKSLLPSLKIPEYTRNFIEKYIKK